METGHYRLNRSPISRGKGRPAAAASDYIHAEGKYAQKEGVFLCEVRAPEDAGEWARGRHTLWAAVEANEVRRNARTACMYVISIPRELPNEARLAAVRGFVDREFVAKGYVADMAFHDFTGKGSHNPHAHVLVTDRPLVKGKFARNKDRALIHKDSLIMWRKKWEVAANQALEREGLAVRVDCRSYKARGIDREPLNESMAENQIRQKEVQALERQMEAVRLEALARRKEKARILRDAAKRPPYRQWEREAEAFRKRRVTWEKNRGRRAAVAAKPSEFLSQPSESARKPSEFRPMRDSAALARQAREEKALEDWIRRDRERHR